MRQNFPLAPQRCACVRCGLGLVFLACVELCRFVRNDHHLRSHLYDDCLPLENRTSLSTTFPFILLELPLAAALQLAAVLGQAAALQLAAVVSLVLLRSTSPHVTVGMALHQRDQGRIGSVHRALTSHLTIAFFEKFDTVMKLSPNCTLVTIGRRVSG